MIVQSKLVLILNVDEEVSSTRFPMLDDTEFNRQLNFMKGKVICTESNRTEIEVAMIKTFSRRMKFINGRARPTLTDLLNLYTKIAQLPYLVNLKNFKTYWCAEINILK